MICYLYLIPIPIWQVKIANPVGVGWIRNIQNVESLGAPQVSESVADSYTIPTPSPFITKK